MILDVQPPVMRRLYLYGALEVKRPLERCNVLVQCACYVIFFFMQFIHFRWKILRTES